MCSSEYTCQNNDGLRYSCPRPQLNITTLATAKVARELDLDNPTNNAPIPGQENGVALSTEIKVILAQLH